MMKNNNEFIYICPHCNNEMICNKSLINQNCVCPHCGNNVIPVNKNNNFFKRIFNKFKNNKLIENSNRFYYLYLLLGIFTGYLGTHFFYAKRHKLAIFCLLMNCFILPIICLILCIKTFTADYSAELFKSNEYNLICKELSQIRNDINIINNKIHNEYKNINSLRINIHKKPLNYNHRTFTLKAFLVHENCNDKEILWYKNLYEYLEIEENLRDKELKKDIELHKVSYSIILKYKCEQRIKLIKNILYLYSLYEFFILCSLFFKYDNDGKRMIY